MYFLISSSRLSPFTLGVVKVKNINSLFSSFLKCSIRIDISKLSLQANLQLHIGQNLFLQKLLLCNFLFSISKSPNNSKKVPQSTTLRFIFSDKNGFIYSLNLGFFNLLSVHLFNMSIFVSWFFRLFLLPLLIVNSPYVFLDIRYK